MGEHKTEEPHDAGRPNERLVTTDTMPLRRWIAVRLRQSSSKSRGSVPHWDSPEAIAEAPGWSRLPRRKEPRQALRACSALRVTVLSSSLPARLRSFEGVLRMTLEGPPSELSTGSSGSEHL